MRYGQIIMWLFLSLMIFSSCSNSQNQTEKKPKKDSIESSSSGRLFIIGGTIPKNIIDEMIKVAQLKKDDYIVTLPMARDSSSGVVEKIEKVTNVLKESTDNKIVTYNFNSSNVDNQEWIDSLSRAKLIFISGGFQAKFMKVVRHTAVFDAIHTAFKNGAIIAGNSAGAAVMSEVMITGKGKDTQKYQKFHKIRYDNVATNTGLGLLPSHTIIDQHFIVRSRYNRLISVLAAHPDYLCVGINEGAAIVCEGEHARVVGDSQIVLLSNPEGLSDTKDSLISFQDIHFSLLKAGDTFKLR